MEMVELEKMLHLSLIYLRVYLIQDFILVVVVQALDHQLQGEEVQVVQGVEVKVDTQELQAEQQQLIPVVVAVEEQVYLDQAELGVLE